MSERLVRGRWASDKNTYRVLAEHGDFLWIVREGYYSPESVHSSNVTELRFEVGRKYRPRNGSTIWTVSEVLANGVAVAYAAVSLGVATMALYDYSAYEEVTE